MKKLQEQYDYLASTYFVKTSPELTHASITAHKLYNATLYLVRQQLFKHKPFLSNTDLNRIFKKRAANYENMLYREMPYVQCAQQTMREVTGIWLAWFKALKAYYKDPSKFTGKPKIPKYLKKTLRHTFFVTSQNARIKNGYLVIPKLNFKLKVAPAITKIRRVTFVPVSHGFKVIINYKTNQTIDYKSDNGRYVGIDPGVDNAFTCVSNVGKPLIINGRALKSVNQFYNKTRSRLKSLQAQYHQLESLIHTKNGPKHVYRETKAMQRVTDWRNRKIMEFAHKASNLIVNYALKCNANTIVIGKNTYWKRSSNMGKKNNQNFIGIPHAKMINMIQYKANLHGITVITTNESYTSQTSFLDHEKPCWNNGNKSRRKQGLTPINRRVHRGLFKTNTGKLINADVNGALQIIKKVFPKVSLANGIVDDVLHPDKYSILI